VLLPSANPASVRAMNKPFWFVLIPSVACSGELGKAKKNKNKKKEMQDICD